MSPSEFIGIYDADSTLMGEVSYWINARLGKTHCSLCELTHGVFTKKNEWKSCVSSLSVPFHTFHRNDAPEQALEVAHGRFPIVLARYVDELRVVFTPQQLHQFNGETREFDAALRRLINGN